MPRARRPSGAPARCATAIDAEQEEERRVGRFRRDPAADPGGRRRRRDCSATTGSPRPTTTSPRGRPDGTGSGWASKSFNELRLLDPTATGVGRDRQGRALAQPDGDRAGQVHGGPRAGGDGRPDRQPGVRGGRPADRRGAQLLLEEGRRQPRRRADRRREGAALLRSDHRWRRRFRSTARGCRSRASTGSTRAC